MMRLIISALVLVSCTGLLAQNQNTRQTNRYRLKRTSEPVIIDGVIDDEAWQAGELIPQLMNHWPKDDGQAIRQRESNHSIIKKR